MFEKLGISEYNKKRIMGLVGYRRHIFRRNIVMVPNENEYSKLFGRIEQEDNKVVAAKCRCVACNSCSCGRCSLCIGQCTGCKSKDLELELEWGMA